MMQFPYKVSKQYGRGSETIFAAFHELSDAQLFIQQKLESDKAMRIAIIYRISDHGEVIAEFDPNKSGDAVSSGSQGQGNKSTFTPTPFNTAPRPSGMPPKWLKDEEDDAEKK